MLAMNFCEQKNGESLDFQGEGVLPQATVTEVEVDWMWALKPAAQGGPEVVMGS